MKRKTVNAVKNKANTRPNDTQKQRKQRPKQYKQYTKKKGAKQNQCKHCGGHHGKGKCPAYCKVCHKCGKENHFQAVCQPGQWLCQVEEFQVMTDTDDSIYGVDSIGTVKHINQKKFFVPLHVCFKKETGDVQLLTFFNFFNFYFNF